MKKKMNKKVILAIELVLIIAGLVLAGIGAFESLRDLPGHTEPEAMEGVEAFAGDPNPAGAADPKPAEDGAPNPAAEEGKEAPAEDGQPLDAINVPRGAGDTFSFVIVYIVPILVYILLLAYVLVEYSKPHGNLLRVIMLAFAFMLAIWSVAQGENAGCVYVLPCTAVIVAYLSGRLNKIRKNIVWISIAAALLIAYGILQTVMVCAISYGVLQVSYCFGAVLQWITLALAYFSRYEEHVAAGTETEPAE